MADSANPPLLTLTAQISAAYVAANTIDAASVPALVNDVYQALTRACAPVPDQTRQEPAVPINRSIQNDYLVSLEDGTRLKMLKPYLKRLGLTPEDYRAKWGLPKGYPMIAPAYAALRAEIGRQVRPPWAASRPAAVEPPTPPAEEEVPLPTAASVFANFPGAEPAVEVPGAEPAVEVPAAPDLPVKPVRKRFAQQSMRQGALRTR